MEGRVHHTAMVVTIEFVKVGLLMPHQLHHTIQVLVLVVTTIEFKLTVTTK